jgi:FAD/FMN-containing dehydrogenase
LGGLERRILSDLQALVGPSKVLTDNASFEHFGRDWTRGFSGYPGVIVLPGNIEEVQDVVRLAALESLAIVPSGGRTGLSGGAVAIRGELVLALDRMNQISDFSAIDCTVRCGAGVVTEQLQEFAREQGLYYPVDFASRGSSQIGGNISTNAGGINVIRYGMTRDWVAGLKVVTGTGQLLDLNRGLVKNNAGYDLRQLIIGAEGTLGIVVEATMKLTRPPEASPVMLLGAVDMPAVMSVLSTYQQALELSAFEFFSDLALSKVIEHQGLQEPFASPAPYYVLLEFEQRAEADLDQAMRLFEHCIERGWVVDGVLSQSVAQAESLWRLREDISDTISR